MTIKKCSTLFLTFLIAFQSSNCATNPQNPLSQPDYALEESIRSAAEKAGKLDAKNESFRDKILKLIIKDPTENPDPSNSEVLEEKQNQLEDLCQNLASLTDYILKNIRGLGNVTKETIRTIKNIINTKAPQPRETPLGLDDNDWDVLDSDPETTETELQPIDFTAEKLKELNERIKKADKRLEQLDGVYKKLRPIELEIKKIDRSIVVIERLLRRLLDIAVLSYPGMEEFKPYIKSLPSKYPFYNKASKIATAVASSIKSAAQKLPFRQRKSLKVDHGVQTVEEHEEGEAPESNRESVRGYEDVYSF